MTREEAITWLENRAKQIPLPGALEVYRMAIAALRELDAQEKQESFGEWISVKDRLPEPNVIVLCCTNKGYVDTDSFGRYSKVFLKCDDMEGKVGQVIAWMPLPEPPKEEKR